MAKLLFIVGVTILIVFLLRNTGRRGGGRDTGRKAGSRQAEDMVRCRVCGVNLPRSEAILSRGQIYCCEEHRRQGQ